MIRNKYWKDRRTNVILLTVWVNKLCDFRRRIREIEGRRKGERGDREEGREKSVHRNTISKFNKYWKKYERGIRQGF